MCPSDSCCLPIILTMYTSLFQCHLIYTWHVCIIHNLCHVSDRIIDFERTTYFMVEGLQVEVCIVLNIALSREVIVSLSSFNMDSVGELFTC